MSEQALSHLKRFVLALQQNNRRGANEAAAALIALAAPLGEKWRLIAKVMQTNGELDAANSAMRLLTQGSGSAQARFDQAAMAAQTGRLEQAWDLMAQVPGDVPDVPGHQYILGMMSLNLGEIERAERHLLAAYDAAPALGQAMLALASCRRRLEGDPIGDRILASAPAMDGAPWLERAQFHFAAGKVHFDRAEADAAFEHFAKGAATMAQHRTYDRAADRADASRGSRGYDRALIESIGARVTCDTDDAIFVTGLPRSGTTLVEQILVSHSAVAGGEELGRMSVVARDLPEHSAAGLTRYAERGDPTDLARLYLHLCRERFGGDQRFVDKGLGNTRHMGLIAALLPKAPIVWLRRDPLDCALSAFRTYFVTGLDWSWKLEDIAEHFRIEDELFAHWAQLLPDRILVVDYAQLVADPRPEIERILAHCGLAAEEQVFEPHKTRRTVATASAAQVIEPINLRGVGSAQAYREHLAPFVRAYEA